MTESSKSLQRQKQRELEMLLQMPSKIIKREIETFAYFQRKSGSPGRTKQTLSASVLNSLKAKLPSYLPS